MPEYSCVLKHRTASDITTIPNLIPPEGSLRRCRHSVYWPKRHEIAWCCQFCNPDGRRPFGAPLSVILPRTNGGHKPDDAIFANKKNPARCPQCNSAVHSVEPDGRWRCEDFTEDGEPCATLYKPPRKKNHE